MRTQALAILGAILIASALAVPSAVAYSTGPYPEIVTKCQTDNPKYWLAFFNRADKVEQNTAKVETGLNTYWAAFIAELIARVEDDKISKQEAIKAAENSSATRQSLIKTKMDGYAKQLRSAYRRPGAGSGVCKTAASRQYTIFRYEVIRLGTERLQKAQDGLLGTAIKSIQDQT